MKKKYIELDENLSLVENVDNNLLKEYRNEDFKIENLDDEANSVKINQ